MHCRQYLQKETSVFDTSCSQHTQYITEEEICCMFNLCSNVLKRVIIVKSVQIFGNLYETQLPLYADVNMAH